MDTEIETIELLDIWNEEFGGIDIDWTGFDKFVASKNGGDANDNGKEMIEKENFHKEKVEKENVEKENNVKAKRGRPCLKPFKPELLIRRRDVSIK